MLKISPKKPNEHVTPHIDEFFRICERHNLYRLTEQMVPQTPESLMPPSLSGNVKSGGTGNLTPIHQMTEESEFSNSMQEMKSCSDEAPELAYYDPSWEVWEMFRKVYSAQLIKFKRSFQIFK